jgi:hypothetical protein
MSLRRVIKLATGQDINACHACFDCELSLNDEMDMPLGSLIQLALLNDEETLLGPSGLMPFWKPHAAPANADSICAP